MVQIQRLNVSLSQGCRGQIKRNHEQIVALASIPKEERPAILEELKKKKSDRDDTVLERLKPSKPPPKQYGCERYVEMLHIINEAWKGNVDSNPAFEEPSMILLEQIFTIDKSRIERFMGYASKAEMLRIDMALLVSLALNVLSGNRSE